MKLSYWMSRHKFSGMVTAAIVLYMSIAIMAYTVPTCTWASVNGLEHWVSSDDNCKCKGGSY